MSDTAVSLLTPPGTGAIATVQVSGPRAWELAELLFTPAGKPLPEAPEPNRFWFGTLGSDEVVLAATAECAVEVHCHGGRRVGRWVIEQFLAHGCIERNPRHTYGCSLGWTREKGEGFELLQRAPTLRTASILLDQLHGAFASEVSRILALLATDPASARIPLRRFAELGSTVGRHLVEPWKVVVAGPPNVGKSSLVNALAGYQRSVVSEVAGTTRDAVSVRTAFDGWPVELIDTAGLRAAQGLEAEGIERARRVLSDADLVVWVLDGTASALTWPDASVPPSQLLVVLNKIDAMIGWGADPSASDAWGAIGVSALSNAGVLGLAIDIARRLVPIAPEPGTAVPFTPRLADLVEAANAALVAERFAEAQSLLRESLAASE